MSRLDRLAEVVFLLAIAAASTIIIVEATKIQFFKPFQIASGLYLALFPTGFLFISVLFSKKETARLSLERLLLGISLSIAINTLAILLFNTVFRVPLGVGATISIIMLLCALMFAVFKLREPLLLFARKKLKKFGVQI